MALAKTMGPTRKNPSTEVEGNLGEVREIGERAEASRKLLARLTRDHGDKACRRVGQACGVTRLRADQ